MKGIIHFHRLFFNVSEGLTNIFLVVYWKTVKKRKKKKGQNKDGNHGEYKMNKINRIIYILLACCFALGSLSGITMAEEEELTSVSIDEEVTIVPEFVVMYGNGPGIRHLENMWYYPGSCMNYEVGTSTHISLYEAYSKETGEKYFIMVFLDKMDNQNFITTGETLTELTNVGVSYCDEKNLDHFDKIRTGLNAYAGTNGRPGIKGMQDVDNEEGFAMAFRADPIVEAEVETE